MADEPLYAFYLARTGISHPGREEILSSMPNGWREVGVSGPKQHCLDHIKDVWTDMRPLSLRKYMEGLAQPGSGEPPKDAV